jgi:hypothetical protein
LGRTQRQKAPLPNREGTDSSNRPVEDTDRRPHFLTGKTQIVVTGPERTQRQNAPLPNREDTDSSNRPGEDTDRRPNFPTGKTQIVVTGLERTLTEGPTSQQGRHR